MRHFFILLPSLLALFILQSATNAQTGVITGRVVAEGNGMPGITVILNPVVSHQRAVRGAQQIERAVTDEDGNYKFTGVAPRAYLINVAESKGYVRQPLPLAERQTRPLVRVGDNITITLIRGGVITGRVTTSTGEPMIGVYVNPTMVRDANGVPVQEQFGGRWRATDDRGVYRLYGLQPGTYVVFARPTSSGPQQSPYDEEMPTYHPSSPRDTAAEINVSSGSEATGVDIRFRGDRGHVVSGTVIGGPDGSPNYSFGGVSLLSAATGNQIGFANATRTGEGPAGFAINGVPDGEYELVARRGGMEEEQSYISTLRRISVRGTDVGGIELKLLPMATLGGKVVLEPSPNACQDKRKTTLEEVLISVRSDSKTPAISYSFQQNSREGAVNEKGEFNIYDLDPVRYFIIPRLPNENWYVKSIATSAPAPSGANARGAARASAPADATRAGVALKAGKTLNNVTVAIAVGAASLDGKIVAAAEVARLPSRLRVHILPAEAAAADDVLRYVEAIASGDGSFAFKNISPGRYLLHARAVPDDEPGDRPPLPVALDSLERAKLRKDAEAMKIEIELQPCQRVKDYVMRINP